MRGGRARGKITTFPRRMAVGRGPVNAYHRPYAAVFGKRNFVDRGRAGEEGDSAGMGGWRSAAMSYRLASPAKTPDTAYPGEIHAPVFCIKIQVTCRYRKHLYGAKDQDRKPRNVHAWVLWIRELEGLMHTKSHDLATQIGRVMARETGQTNDRYWREETGQVPELITAGTGVVGRTLRH